MPTFIATELFDDIREPYRRWAPVYDTVFGKLVEAGVKQAAARANEYGKLLEWRELARVTKPGGVVLIVNHFSVSKGLRGAIEKSLAKHARKLGWRSEFQYETLLVSDRLRLASITAVKPLGFFTMLEFRKSD